MIALNATQCDWLTVTSWSESDLVTFRQWLNKYGDGIDLQRQRRQQYHGIANGSLFAGVGQQQRGEHYLFQASGEAADAVYMAIWPIPKSMKVTRFDLQVTVEVESDIDWWSWRSDLQTSSGWGNGRPPSTRIIVSDTATLYVGARTSDRMVRIYQKKLAEGGRPPIRFEVEFKGVKALAAASKCGADRENMRAVLRGEVNRIPTIPSALATPLAAVLPAHGSPLAPVEKPEHDGTKAWLDMILETTLPRMLRDHDHGAHFRESVRRLAQVADALDEAEET